MTIVRKYRIYPNEQQQQAILQTCGCCRVVYNTCLTTYTDNYRKWVENGKPQGEFDDTIPTAKEIQLDGKPWMKQADALALSCARMNFVNALNTFFKSKKGKRKGRKVGFPKLKSRRKSRFAYQTSNQGSNIRFNESNTQIKLPKLGWVNVVQHRPLPDNGTIKRVTVSMTSAGEFHVSLNIECEKQLPLLNRYNSISDPNVVGLDMSLPKFCVSSESSDDTRIKYEHNYRKEEEHIKKLSHVLSRKTHYKKVIVDGVEKKVETENYKKARKRLARLHGKVARRREDFIIKLALYFVRKYDVISIEDLDIQAMSRTLNLGKSVMDLGWGKFVSWLEKEAEKYDAFVYKVDKWFASSKTCHECGSKNSALQLSDREWVCPVCGCIIDRDRNASLNIRDEFLRDFHGCCGVPYTKFKRAGGESAATFRETLKQVFSMKQENPNPKGKGCH